MTAYLAPNAGYQRARHLALMVAAATMLLLAVSAQAAHATSPNWKLLAVTGPTNLPPAQSEIQQVAVDATTGSFTLTFGGQTTSPLAYDASAADVQSALNALSSIGGAGASVSVSGGPGDAGATKPYNVAFGDSLANTNVAQMTADSTSLSGGGHTATATTSLPGGPGTGAIAVYATNIGGASTSGLITLSVTLPAGITTSGTAGGVDPGTGALQPPAPLANGWNCAPTGSDQSTVSCATTKPVAPGKFNLVEVPVKVGPAASGTQTAQVSVSGGGVADPASYDEPITVSTSPASAGVQAYWAAAFDADGEPYTQAGGHPFQAMTAFLLNTVRGVSGSPVPAGDLKDSRVDLPPGFVGNPQAPAKCPISGSTLNCPLEAIVGSVTPLWGAFGQTTGSAVFNNEPDPGDAAQFSFKTLSAPTVLAGSVRSDGDFGVSVTATNTVMIYKVYGAFLSFWGVPGDSRHDIQRCFPDINTGLCVTPAASTNSQAFLTNPTDCGAEAISPPLTILSVNSWQHPNTFDSTAAASPPVTGCDQVPFDPSVDITPTSTAPDSASGLGVGISVPQPGLTDPAQIATGSLRKAVVQLPEGVSVNPSSATGLEGCSDDQAKIGSLIESTCPDGSKIGSVSIDSPLLDEPLKGDVYLGSPLSIDPTSGKMLRLFIVAHSDRYGVTLKLPGSVVADPDTGQLTATFDNNPRLPFTHLQVDFKGGQRGILAMPQTCGMQNTTATLTPWSNDSGQVRTVPVNVTGDCSDGFAPKLEAGMSTQRAGGTGSFALKFSREEGEQYFKGLTASLPAGLLANVGSVQLCTSAQAAADACPLASRIGSADATAGSGDPFVLEKKGDVYLTEGYKGGAFGLLAHVPVEAGPFTGQFALPTVTVRQALFVDKHDAHVTVVSDPFPTIDAGIPLRIRSVTVNVDRPGFMLNPTSCKPKMVGAYISSTQGATVARSTPFNVTGCANLPFAPQFSATSDGRLKFKKGASLNVHMAVPKGDANIASVETVLPKELPSRLIPTIRHACVLKQYLADYTKCPSDSFIGNVTAVSPILHQPLKGPAYIVAPPNDVPRVELKLFGQGPDKGVAVDLEGSVIVDIGDGRSKVTFNTVPDVPVTSFDLDLPAGDHSILDAPSYDTCKGPIRLFLRIVGQNGKVSEGYKPVKVTNCPTFTAAKVVSSKTTASGISIRVKPPVNDGRLVVSGKWVTPVARTIIRPYTYTVHVPLSKAGKTGLKRHGKLSTKLAVWFKPTNSPKASTVHTHTITVHKAKKKKTRR